MTMRDDLTQLLVDEEQRRALPVAPPPTPPLGALADQSLAPQNIVPPVTIPKNNPLPTVEHPDLISRMTARDPRVPLTDLQAQQRKIAFGTTGAPGEQRGFGAIDITPMGTLAQVGEAIEKHDPFSFAGAFNPMGAAAGGVAGAAAKFAPAMFLGAGAIGAPKKAFTLARKMEREGASPSAIMDVTADLPAGRTGLEKLADKKYRYEISDAGSSVNHDVLSRAPLEGSGQSDVGFPMHTVFNHPELYKAAPYTRDIEVKRLPDIAGIRGGYDPERNQIFLNEKLSPTEARDVILHELQHSVQNFEKFSQGGSQYLDAVKKRGKEIEFEVYQNTKQRLADLTAQLNSYVNEKSAGTATGTRSQDLAARWAKENPELAQELALTGKQYNNIPGAARYEAYRRLIGEAEARNTAKRADLSIEERFLKRPETTEDIPREKQWPYRERVQPSNLQLEQTAPGSILAPFPQYAEKYPPVGPPTMVPKDNPKYKGETYPQKTLTPEAAEFAAARTKIAKDVQAGNYEPYFDPGKRFDVDPSKYPKANVDTLTIRPQREKTIAEYEKIIETPETRKLLRDAFAKGQKLGDTADWYAMGQLEKEYVKEYGAKEGRKQFLESFAVPMAATTSGNNPTANYLMAHYFETLRKRGEPIPEGHQLPTPVGGRRANVNIRDYESVMEKGGYSGLGENTPKMHNFSRSFIGDLSRGVMDEQMAGGMLKGAKPEFIEQARKTGYGMLEGQLHTEAARKGLAPGNFQDVAWAGFKNEAGGPMIKVINDAIERTHRLTGMPKAEIVRRGIVRKEIPIYGLGGAALGMGALADQSRYEQ